MKEGTPRVAGASGRKEVQNHMPGAAVGTPLSREEPDSTGCGLRGLLWHLTWFYLVLQPPNI